MTDQPETPEGVAEGTSEALDGLREAPEAPEAPEGVATAEEAAAGSAQAQGEAAADEAAEEPDGTDVDDEDEPSLGAPSLDAALEAVLLVTDQPIDVPTLASLVRRPAGRWPSAWRRSRLIMPLLEGVSTSARSPGAGASTPARTARRWSSATSATASRRA